MKVMLFLTHFVLLTTTGICDYPSPPFKVNPFKVIPFKGTALPRLESLDGSGLTQQQLNDLSKYLEQHAQTTGLVVLYDGKVAFEYGNIKEVTYIASCRKSILSMLYGKHVHNGTIDLDEEIGSIGIDEDDGLLPIEKKATVDHLITSRSGVFHVPANGGYDEKNVLARGSVQPGSYFVYNNWDFNVAGHVLEVKTGNSVYEELENQLAIPLGFQDWNLKLQKKKHGRQKSRYPAYHIYVSTRDMAKIGQLMLNEGQWNGEPLIPRGWMQKITAPVTPKEIVNQRYGLDSSSDIQMSYGYMWWIVENLKGNADFDRAFSATGYGGQYITVVPRRKMVIAHKTKLNVQTRLGLSTGGVSNRQYWKIVHKLIANQKDLTQLNSDDKDVDEIIAIIREQVKDGPNSAFDTSQSGIDDLGDSLMNASHHQDALRIFHLNTELYPTAFKTFDRYGECLAKLNRDDDAVVAYQKSLQLNPGNFNAAKSIEELQSGN